MKLVVSVSVGVALALSLAASGPAAAQEAAAPAGPLDHVQQVGGWTVSDTGSKPGDDGDREVKLSRSIEDLDVFLFRTSPDGVGLTMKFSRCDGLNANSGFSVEGAIPARIAQIRAEIHDEFKDFAKSCPPKAGEEETLMAGFDDADRLLETWLHDRPFTYPPEAPEPKAAKGKKKR